ncbi:GNAT family N-acetyltransferase [Phycicoccus sonneratiae]|uniref:GNAT family N-acetyltransferase n=1 Tax=Phycicoccus sonneratiae TaxID=2807628 RepID=A0ABS2CHE0_9MICO|nr:GNAT family N-acetyltransferase [Phycicoccus sonneraticus]MBM6399286.1 GNAT family N-acetyltransferase [Phycicoccus sonneraticus]
MRPTPPPVLVVDAANVVGSRPDGWWRDRPGAAARLHAALVAARSDEVVLVLEGRARAGVPEDDRDGVRVVHAQGAGDDRVVEEVAALVAAGRATTVVTADRGLVGRVVALGASVTGPRALLDRLAPPRVPPAVRLRPLSEDDLRVHAAGCDALVVRWSGGGQESTDEDHLRWLRANARAWREGGDLLDVAVEDVRSGEHVGVVGVQRHRPELEPDDVNLTYAVYAGHRGRGYATAAVSAAMALAAQRAPVRRFVIRCDPENRASAEVALRAGFEALGPVTEPDGSTLLRFVLDVG